MVNGSLARNGIVALSPSGHALATRVSQRLTALGYTVQTFNSDDEINTLARSELYGLDPAFPRICFAVSFTGNSPNYTYKLRYNITESPSTTQKVTLDDLFNTRTVATPFASGMFTVNNLIHNEILRTETADDTQSLLPTISPMLQ